MKFHQSLQAKIFAPLLIIFLVILGTAIYQTQTGQSRLGHELAAEKVQVAANSYIDQINILMDLGEMGLREIVQEKLTAEEGIIEAHLIRSDLINEKYGPGNPDQRVADDLDRRAMAGETINQLQMVDGKEVFTHIRPIPALEEYRGSFCMSCHEEDGAKVGQILGAVRISYDLSEVNDHIADSVASTTLIQVIIFIIAFAVLVWSARRTVTQPVELIDRELQEITNNFDLVHRISYRSKDQLGSLSHSMNRMLQAFHGSISKVATATTHISTTSNQIADLARSTQEATSREHQDTEVIAAAIEEMEATSQELQRSAEQTAQNSSEADAAAGEADRLSTVATAEINDLQQVLTKLEDVSRNLGERCNNVGSVLVVIKTIAEQTNLLALNAAIEAARAGESGRGFAVVADEVRTLSQRTHESTDEIESMIQQLQNESSSLVNYMNQASAKADSSVDKVAQTVQALHQITTKVSEINLLNDQVATAAEEQCAVSSDVSRNIHQIREVSDGTLRQAQQSAEAAEELLERFRELDEVVQSFKL
ncbi:methyl-accepting chemotaxis protein [Aestuariirhabdus litorea]|uniref:Methyl-accepting chemotaxis protein n=1 Tax=Aestuariirhabdus litorea TaxID=2528527 RepID=A0A3P3VIF0_9GAMM|nr:methyl-accepting chemotaxis protein [Aestuariirhabdus litorea]RRJ82442.1 methyl-accepting chemotaxis protein [Aestuariirhabdus litorea]RWW92605.1 HAMP domain-containing protein [Endozoicomonadaceae bacterium GTF-13]